MNIYRKLLLIIVIAVASAPYVRSEVTGFEPGAYENILLAISSKGTITGYYREAQGEGAVKTCAFTFNGDAHADKANIIVNADKSFSGEIHSETDGINLKIEKGREIPGCGLVLMPEIASGLSYDLITKAPWSELRTITRDKSFFYSEPKSGNQLKAYLVKGDVVGVVTSEGDWLQIDYYSDSGKMSRRWIKKLGTSTIIPTK